MSTKLKSVLSWVLPIVIGLLIALLIRQFWFTMVKVDGDSMLPNLKDNERVVAFKTSPVKRGSVIVFHSYGVDAKEKNRNGVYVKRVVAVAGDTVRYTRPLSTSDAAPVSPRVDLGGRRIIAQTIRIPASSL